MDLAFAVHCLTMCIACTDTLWSSLTLSTQAQSSHCSTLYKFILRWLSQAATTGLFFYVPNTGALPHVNIWGRFLLFLTILSSIWEQQLLVLLYLISTQIHTTAIRFVVPNLLQSLYGNCLLGEQFWLEEQALPRLNSGWWRL
jgi:hypothetical protein